MSSKLHVIIYRDYDTMLQNIISALNLRDWTIANTAMDKVELNVYLHYCDNESKPKEFLASKPYNCKKVIIQLDFLPTKP